MLVDSDGKFLTQRQQAKMCLITVSIAGDDLVCTAPGMPELVFAMKPTSRHGTLTVTIWNDQCEAELAATEISDWFSGFLGIDCRLVYMPDSTHRLVDRDYTDNPGDIAGFADGFPLLMISDASLEDLNQRIVANGGDRLPMERFRPNVVITGCEPYAEDSMTSLTGINVELLPVKPCSRCVIPSIDIETAEKGAEPLSTLASYRRLDGKKIYFGMNVLYRVKDKTLVSVGDEFDVSQA
jgi:uncharacterized protein YcbX